MLFFLCFVTRTVLTLTNFFLRNCRLQFPFWKFRGVSFVFYFKQNIKDFSKLSWPKTLKDISLIFEASEPAPNNFKETVVLRADFYGLSFTDGAIEMLSYKPPEILPISVYTNQTYGSGKTKPFVIKL